MCLLEHLKLHVWRTVCFHWTVWIWGEEKNHISNIQLLILCHLSVDEKALEEVNEIVNHMML